MLSIGKFPFEFSFEEKCDQIYFKRWVTSQTFKFCSKSVHLMSDMKIQMVQIKNKNSSLFAEDFVWTKMEKVHATLNYIG